MEATATRRKRTREEILVWLDEACQRKAAWQSRMQAEFAERERLRREAAEPDDCYMEEEYTNQAFNIVTSNIP